MKIDNLPSSPAVSSPQQMIGWFTNEIKSLRGKEWVRRELKESVGKGGLGGKQPNKGVSLFLLISLF